jgi:hypothetical protein
MHPVLYKYAERDDSMHTKSKWCTFITAERRGVSACTDRCLAGVHSIGFQRYVVSIN